MEKQKTRPVHQLTMPCAGALLKVAVWRHQQGEQRPRFAVSVSRAHRGKDAKNWTFDGYFRRDELLALAALITSAHGWIVTSDSKKEAANG